MNINLTNKQTNKYAADQSPRRNFQYVQLKYCQFEQDTSGRKRTAVDEANKISTLTVRPAHCQIAAACM
jgi:hypothetical protein